MRLAPAGTGKLCEAPEKPVSRSEPFERVAGSTFGTVRHSCFGVPSAEGLLGQTASQPTSVCTGPVFGTHWTWRMFFPLPVGVVLNLIPSLTFFDGFAPFFLSFSRTMPGAPQLDSVRRGTPTFAFLAGPVSLSLLSCSGVQTALGARAHADTRT